MTRDRAETNPLPAFFALTYLCSWLIWIPIAMGWVHPLATGLGAAAPSLVGILLTSKDGGREAVKALVRQALPRRGDAHLYAAALCIPVVTAALGVALYSLIAAAPFRLDAPFPWWLVPLHLVAGLAFLGPLQEEFGWRGYALPRLLISLGPVPSSLILGVLWGLWHLPLFFIGGSFQSHQPFGLFLLSTVALSLPYTLLYLMTERRLMSALIFHASTNTAATVTLYEPTLDGNLGPLAATTAMTTFVGLGAAVLLQLRSRRTEIPLRPLPKTTRR